MFKTIYVLWLRQLKRFFRSKSRIIGSLGQSVLFLVALGFGFGPIFQKAGQGNYMQFLAPGIIAMGVLFTATFNGIELIWDRQFGFLKETLVAPVSRLEIMIGRTLGGATIAVLQGIIVFLIALAIGFRPDNWAMLPIALLFMIIIAIIFTALGTAIASVLDDMHGFQLIINFMLMPLFFLSGALFPLTDLPVVLDWIVKLNPLSYGIDAMRGALTGATHLGFMLDSIVLGIVLVVFVSAGSYLFSKMQV